MKKTRFTLKYAILTAIAVLAILFFMLREVPEGPKISIPKAAKPKIAIVLDDWGYNINNLNLAGDIKYPLTAAVLPNLQFSRKVCEALHAQGKEIILHLPMEPNEVYRLEEDTILTSLNADSTKKILKRDLESLKYAKGVSNHMGSRVTANEKVMVIIFNELKRKHLYFLDSFVSSKTICQDLARKMNLPFAKRDVFLDNIGNPDYIRGQILKLKLKAKAYGRAIGIGHDRKTTLMVLSEMMPALAKEGYEFVVVSDLAK